MVAYFSLIPACKKGLFKSSLATMFDSPKTECLTNKNNMVDEINGTNTIKYFLILTLVK